MVLVRLTSRLAVRRASGLAVCIPWALAIKTSPSGRCGSLGDDGVLAPKNVRDATARVGSPMSMDRRRDTSSKTHAVGGIGTSGGSAGAGVSATTIALCPRRTAAQTCPYTSRARCFRNEPKRSTAFERRPNTVTTSRPIIARMRNARKIAKPTMKNGSATAMRPCRLPRSGLRCRGRTRRTARSR